MPLWMAIILFILAAAGIVLSCIIPKGSKARTPCIIICALLALACAAYIGLTLLLVDAVSNQPPTL